MNYDLLTTLGAAPYGLAEVGEVLGMVDEIRAAGTTVDAYFSTFRTTAEKLLKRARRCERNGDRVGATTNALRASNYFQSALFYVLGSATPSAERRVYDQCRSAWDLAVPGLATRVEELAIPYGDRTMPGWFFSPDSSKRTRRTLIISNGSDGQNPWVWGFAAAPALQYGWNVVVFEGPGQGSMLFRDRIPFRHDWEHVIGPVIDHIERRRDVDRSRIALLGGSMSGELTARAASFEHRLAALVTAPGTVSPWRAFPEIIRDVLGPDARTTNASWADMIPFLGDHASFIMSKRFEIYDPKAMMAARRGVVPPDFWTATRTLLQQDVTDVAHLIECPTLVIDYEGETFYAGQADELAGLLTCRHDLVRMTAADGAQLHCSPMAPQYHADVVFSWLDDTVGVG